jgi:hypothetical protein
MNPRHTLRQLLLRSHHRTHFNGSPQPARDINGKNGSRESQVVLHDEMKQFRNRKDVQKEAVKICLSCRWDV